MPDPVAVSVHFLHQKLPSVSVENVNIHPSLSTNSIL